MSHTPGPFRVYHNQYDGEYRVYQVDGHPLVNSLFKGKEAKEDAEFIVRACNCHYELLEACKMMLHHVPMEGDEDMDVREFAEDAITKATGQKGSE